VLARRALGRPAPDEETLIQRLVGQLLHDFKAAGSIGGAVVPTIWRAHEVLDLDRDSEAGCGPLMDWVLDLQSKPGAFSQGCTRIRHGHRVCEHFISGFFSPAPPEQRVAPVMLPNGKVFRAEPAARFAISCLALRAALRGRWSTRQSVQRHGASLLQLQEQWVDWNGYFAGDAIVAGIHALALIVPSDRQLRARLSSLIASHQAPDGTWPTADLFHTLETLLALGTPEARAAVRRAIPLLLARQRIDGTFGSTAQQERALIALRSLLWAEQEG
jgi:Arc/MetJ family transcription regulator